MNMVWGVFLVTGNELLHLLIFFVPILHFTGNTCSSENTCGKSSILPADFWQPEKKQKNTRHGNFTSFTIHESSKIPVGVGCFQDVFCLFRV